MKEDPNEHYNKFIVARSHEGDKVEHMIYRLDEFYKSEKSHSEVVDEIKTLWRLKGCINKAQYDFLEKLVSRHC